MQAMQPFIIIADFVTSTNSSDQVKPYSFAMVAHCIYDINNNKLSHYTGNNYLNKFFEQLINHVDHIDKIYVKLTPHSNTKVYKTNPINPICLICNYPIKTENNAHGYRYYCNKIGNLHGFKHGGCNQKKQEITVLFHNGATFNFRLIIEYLASECLESDISCIANSIETLMTFYYQQV